ncbi:MAG: GNAT family N-acetyltransferase [Bifidobacteriaceae bacterium]|jgi:putative glutathione S-transferase|nr:GNAT family N-acetyltransferase [Bifidobacteriaceae bacterium]
MTHSTLTATGAVAPPAAVRLPGDLIIREARPEEYGAAEDVLVAAFTTGCWVSEDYERHLRTLAQRSAAWHIWVAAAADGGGPLAVVLTPRVEFWTRDHFTFSVLAVSPKARGLGLGAALTDHAIGLARAHGYRVTQINSSPQMSAAHRLYYAKGFVRRPERETAFVSEYDERLLTFTYHDPDPLPQAQVVRVQRRPGPDGGPPFLRAPDRSRWPARPAGSVDPSGAFIPAAAPPEALERAGRVAARLAERSALAPPAPDEDPDEDQVIQQLHADLGVGAQTALWSPEREASEAAVRVFFARLDTLEQHLAAAGPFLAGGRPSRADVHLFSLLLAYDLGWRAGFAAVGAVADWPRLWRQARSLLALADLSPAERRAAGLAPLADAVYAEPYGPPPPAAGLGDVRGEWLAAADALRRRRPARDPAVPVLPYPSDWPGGRPAAEARALIESTRTQLRGLAPQAAAAALVEVIDADLLGSLERLIGAGDDLAAALAGWRLYWARLDWFNARLKGRSHLAGDRPTAADSALAATFQAYPPDLRDFPRLARWRLENCQDQPRADRAGQR